MLPEQIWDEPDKDGLVFGGPAGSAMPLVWAHSEYLKLLRSATYDGRVFDCIPIVEYRYAQGNHPPSHIEVFKVSRRQDSVDGCGEDRCASRRRRDSGEVDAGNWRTTNEVRQHAGGLRRFLCGPADDCRSKRARLPLLCSGRMKIGGKARISKSRSKPRFLRQELACLRHLIDVERESGLERPVCPHRPQGNKPRRRGEEL